MVRKIKSDHHCDRPEDFPYCMVILPDHLDKLLELPWTPEASRLIDLWLWYLQAEEFEGGRYG